MVHGAAAPHRPGTPGQRRRAGPRPPREVAAGPGFNCRGTAPPGWASTIQGLRRRAGPRLARDGAAGPGLDLPGTAGGHGLFGAQGCASSPVVSDNVCGMSVTAIQQQEPPASTRTPEPGPGNSGLQSLKNCAHLSRNKATCALFKSSLKKNGHSQKMSIK
jgi:hypothetical protein